MADEKESGEDSLFWADQIARLVKKRVAGNPLLRKITKAEG